VTSDGNNPRGAQAGASPIPDHPSRLSLIVAMARNRAIGVNGRIPWHLPDELKLFKKVTMGHHIIMGRKTWESIGRQLPGRSMVVVSRRSGYGVPGALVADSLERAIAACAGDTEIFVIGGSELFRAALPLADRLYLTTVEAEVAGDTFMPEFHAAQWREIESGTHSADSRHPYAYRHAILERVRHQAQ